MLNPPFYMGTCIKKYIWNNPLDLSKNTLTLFVSLISRVYGLKQAPRAWDAKMDSFLLDNGFSRCHYDNTINTKKVGKLLIILVLYVDDIILTSSDPNHINHVNSSLKNNFEMTDLGHLHYFLGLQVLQSK